MAPSLSEAAEHISATSRTRVSSTTVAVIAKYRTTSKRCLINFVPPMLSLNGVVYGGNHLSTLTQKSTNKVDDTKIKTNFLIEVFKSMWKWTSAEANSTITVEERRKINSFNSTFTPTFAPTSL